MTALIVVLAVIALLAIAALVRFGAVFEYSEDGAALACVCGPFMIKLIPGPKKRRKKKTDKKPEKKERKQKKEKKETEPENTDKKRGGAVDKVRAVLPTALKTAGRFFKHLRIDELTLEFVLNGDDPCDTALNYGYASAAMGFIVPVIKRSFRVKKWNVNVIPSFIDSTETVYIKARLTIAIWEIIYIISRLDFKAILSIL